MAHAFFLGVDFASADNGDALSGTLTILEKDKEPSAAEAHYRLDHVRRHTEVQSVSALASHIQDLVAAQPYIGRTSIVVNRGRPSGEALLGALTDRGLDPIAATLTVGSGAVSGEPDEMGVALGTADAVRALANLHRDDRLVIEDHAPEAASELARGVQRAAEVLDEADGDQSTPEAAGSTLEPLQDVGTALTSAALAAWVGAERSFDPSQRLKETPQTRPQDRTPEA